MRLMPIFASLFCTVTFAESANGTPRQEIGVAISDHDASSQQLSRIIESKISKSDVLEIARKSDPDYVLTRNRIVIDRLANKDVLIYDFVLSYKHKNNVHLIGVCYRKNLSVCASKVVNKIRGFAISKLLEK